MNNKHRAKMIIGTIVLLAVTVMIWRYAYSKVYLADNEKDTNRINRCCFHSNYFV